MYGVKFCLLKSTAKLNSPPTEPQVHSNGVKMFGLVFLFKNLKGLVFLVFLLYVFIGEVYTFNTTLATVLNSLVQVNIRLYLRWECFSSFNKKSRKAVIIYIHCLFCFTCCLILVVLRGEMNWILREEWACGEWDLLNLGFYSQWVLSIKRLSIGVFIKETILTIT